MKKHHSRIGLIASLAIHGALIGGSFALLNEQKIEKSAEQNSLSMEMVAALLEQPQVAVSPDPIEEVKEIEPEKVDPQPEPEPEPVPEPEAIPEPVLKPKKEEPKKEKPKEEKRKERPKEKKEKPKEEKRKEKEKPQQKPIKALERGPEVKQGIVAKAIPNAIQGEKMVAGVAGGQKGGSLNSTSTTGSNVTGGNASELSAYKTALQRALQRKANNSYPQREKMMRKTGTVTIKFTITSSGAISNVSVVNSSGNSNLDNAAVKSAQAVSMPPPPAGFPPSVTVPIKFSLE
ncbi:TonB family protein [Mannheimia bovis]|uniref:Protein TonB n=1 Tax=Mannheimia bovis TaxID=2770636 RepID=A0A7H1C2F2_9PAST|nr:energy transducer TonB [Mannheimia bovis]QNS15157.1 energy transducer TonB [Mannheimia bovis]